MSGTMLKTAGRLVDQGAKSSSRKTQPPGSLRTGITDSIFFRPVMTDFGGGFFILVPSFTSFFFAFFKGASFPLSLFFLPKSCQPPSDATPGNGSKMAPIRSQINHILTKGLFIV